MNRRTALGLAAGGALCLLLLGPLIAWLDARDSGFAPAFVAGEIEEFHRLYRQYPRSLTDPRFLALAHERGVVVTRAGGKSVYAVCRLEAPGRPRVGYVEYRFLDRDTPPVITAVSPPRAGHGSTP